MWWQILGVKHDADLTTIKRAYSALIKQYRPESHPEQFSQIRAAFEQAKKQATTPPLPIDQPIKLLPQEEPQKEPIDTDDTVLPNEPCFIEAQQPIIIEYSPLPTLEKPPIPLIQLQPTVTAEYAHPKAPEKPIIELIELLEAWKKGKFKDHTWIDKVLTHPDTLEFYALKAATTDVFRWLVDNVKPSTPLSPTPINMPVKALARLDRLFGWSSCERELYLQYHPVDLSLIFYGIAAGNGNYQPLINFIQRNTANTRRTAQANHPYFLKTLDWAMGFIAIYTAAFLFIILFMGSIVAIHEITTQMPTFVQIIFAILGGLLFCWGIDGVYFSFTGSKKLGLTKGDHLIHTIRLWKFYIRRWINAILVAIAIVLLECLVGVLWYALASFYWVEKDGFIGLLAIPLLWLSYWLNKELLIFVRRSHK